MQIRKLRYEPQILRRRGVPEPRLFFDAELIRGKWFYEARDGECRAFSKQKRVTPVTELGLQRRHNGDWFESERSALPFVISR